MKDEKDKKKRLLSLTGFTVAEVLIASSIALLIIGASFAIWLFIQGIWNAERIKSDILGNMQIAMERMKQELALSDGNKTLTADNGISFPNAEDSDNDGFIELNASNKIIWDETIVYHVYNSGDKYELRKTVFSPRNNNIDNDARQAQLGSVIANGNGISSKAQGENANTDTIIKGFDYLNLAISPSTPIFDGYAGEVSRGQNVSFGSILLDQGYHTIKFEIVGKDDRSSSYGLGIDTFSITPSGCVNEAEDYISLVHPDGSSGIAGSSGDAITKENMVSYGVWGGNYQLDYGSNSKNDYVTLRFYYDSWRETNFNQGSLENVVIKFSNEDGAGGNSGDYDYVLSLDGNQIKTTELAGTKNISQGSGDNTSYRVITSFPASGRLCGIKFNAGTSSSLTIEKAYISEKIESESGQDGGTSYAVTFANCDIDPRNSGQVVSPYNGGEGITIPAGKFGWSNWIDMGANIDGGKEYFITFYIRGLTADQSMSMAYLEGTSGDTPRSYIWLGDHANVSVWSSGGAEVIGDPNSYAVKETAVRYVDQGVYASQIYDTGMDNPQFDKIIWNIKRNNTPDADVKLFVRSSDDKDALKDTSWTGPIDAGSAVSGSASISSIAGGRYAQFKAEFYSYESGEDSSHQTNDTDDSYTNDEDYDISSILKDVTITWPGNLRIVDISGCYTLKPSYGKFTVKIDGQNLIKGLEAKLTAKKKPITEEDITRSLNTEIEFRNTNK